VIDEALREGIRIVGIFMHYLINIRVRLRVRLCRGGRRDVVCGRSTHSPDANEGDSDEDDDSRGFHSLLYTTK